MFRKTYLEKTIWIGKHFSQQWKTLQFEFSNSKQNNQAAVQAGFEMWTVLMLEVYYFFDVLVLNILEMKKLIMTIFQGKETTCMQIMSLPEQIEVFSMSVHFFSCVYDIQRNKNIYCVLHYL